MQIFLFFPIYFPDFNLRNKEGIRVHTFCKVFLFIRKRNDRQIIFGIVFYFARLYFRCHRLYFSIDDTQLQGSIIYS